MKVLGNRRRFFAPVIIMLSAFTVIFMAACSTSQQTATISNTSNSSNSSNSSSTIQFNTQLTHSPTGFADLSWNHDDHKLTVKVYLSGLAPDSTHPEHIHAGTCTSMPMGAVVYTLQPMVADAHGVATATSVIEN